MIIAPGLQATMTGLETVLCPADRRSHAWSLFDMSSALTEGRRWGMPNLPIRIRAGTRRPYGKANPAVDLSVAGLYLPHILEIAEALRTG